MMIGMLASGPPPKSLFTPIYEWFIEAFPQAARWMGVHDPHAPRHLHQMWFEGLCWSLVACTLLIIIAWSGTRRLERIPRGLQALWELVIGGFRSMVGGMMGAPMADRYVPFIGGTFLFIFFMNLLGVLPAGRSPTMALSITAGMGVTAFLLVMFYIFRDAGIGTFLKHLAGPVWWLAPLIFVAELISILIRPVSLSMRLYGNIYGEDNVIEAFLGLGGWIPLQFPILLLAMLTSFLQAYIFTMLCTYYIASMVVHEEGHGQEQEAHAEGHGAPVAAHVSAERPSPSHGARVVTPATTS